DFKLSLSKESLAQSDRINEFLYYIDNTLVAYLGICCFGGNAGEINGMTHPSFRRHGLFRKLFTLAVNECKRRSFSKLLLLSDDNSASGKEFIKAMGAEYDFSEYRMKLTGKAPSEDINPITLRPAGKDDRKELKRQDAIYFNDPIDSDDDTIEFFAPNEISYLSELSGNPIGKIRVDYDVNSAFICGFGILPEYRGQGYGKATLKETIRMIHENGIDVIGLDVECKNSNALNLYKSCGFKEQSVMNYYKYSY
ncbi:MAG TPA: GNAT family N-acetyltransferase, partial [Mobilitalea sp.]|nr:GNAT family N-acetyltransferase [Mobilitalea sp.]